MPPHYDIVFLLTAPRGHLVEVRRLDQPVGSPKNRVYHWLWIEGSAVVTLHFVSMSSAPHQRDFEEAVLRFDDAGGELRWRGGDTVALLPRASQDLPQVLHGLIQQHLS